MDQVTAKADPEKAYAKPPEGSHICVVVDGVDLGMQQETYPGKPTRLVHKYAIVWQIDEINPDTITEVTPKGKRFEVSKEFTVSMGEKANLRKFLATWRGKSYTDAEAAEGAPLHKLYGAPGLMQIEHKQSKSNADRTYTNVISVVKLPKGVAPIQPLDYVRSEHWKERIAKQADGPVIDSDGFPVIDDEDSELPF